MNPIIRHLGALLSLGSFVAFGADAAKEEAETARLEAVKDAWTTIVGAKLRFTESEAAALLPGRYYSPDAFTQANNLFLFSDHTYVRSAFDSELRRGPAWLQGGRITANGTWSYSNGVLLLVSSGGKPGRYAENTAVLVVKNPNKVSPYNVFLIDPRTRETISKFLADLQRPVEELIKELQGSLRQPSFVGDPFIMWKPDNSGSQSEIEAQRERLRVEDAVLGAIGKFGLTYSGREDIGAQTSNLVSRIVPSTSAENTVVLRALSDSDFFAIKSGDVWFRSTRVELTIDLSGLKLAGPVTVSVGRMDGSNDLVARDGITVSADGKITLGPLVQSPGR